MSQVPDYTVLPYEVVSEVIGSYDEDQDVVRRRHLGPRWLERYHRMIRENYRKTWVIRAALEDHDEDFLIDVLTLRNRDPQYPGWDTTGAFDFPAPVPPPKGVEVAPTDESHRPVRSLMLGILFRAITAGFSQEFGHRLAQLGVMMTQLALVLTWYWSQWSKEGTATQVQQQVTRLDWLTTALAHYDGVFLAVLIPCFTRFPRNNSQTMIHTNDPVLVSKTMDWRHRHTIFTGDQAARFANHYAQQHTGQPEWQPVVDQLLSYR